MPPVVPVKLHCLLCSRPDDGWIVTTAARQWTAAVHHAIDEHRPQYDANPAAAMKAFTVTGADGEPKLLPAPQAA